MELNAQQKIGDSFKDRFAHFLFQKDLLQLILAVYLGNVLQDSFNSYVQGILMPLILLFIPNSQYTDFNDIEIKIFGANIAIGTAIIKTINLLIGFMMSYFIVTHFLYRYLK